MFMYSSLICRTTLPTISQLPCRQIPSFSSSTAIRRFKAEVQTISNPQCTHHIAALSTSAVTFSENDPTSTRSTNRSSLAVNSKNVKPSPTLTNPSETSSSQTLPDQPFPHYRQVQPLRHRRSPITNWFLASPQRTAVLLKIGDWLGYGSPKQIAGRRSKVIYTVCSEVALGPERDFWYDTLSLPPSFQSWFTITNLHVWLVTVRLRALPPSHGRPFVQALIDHFFFDVEDRLRTVLGKKAPERLVTRHMKIFREQWAGLGIACDIALLTGDKDMASAMWRNLLGARGARGIAYPDSFSNMENSTKEIPPSETLPSAPPTKAEDPSSGGVTDFEGPAIDKYVMYPQLMLILTSYIRRELVRIERVSDITILGGVGKGMRESVFGPEPGTDFKAAMSDLKEAFKFGNVKDAARKIGAEISGI
ncbi:hypothetical protein K439DRAFT_1394760 [Ramaria rubella]|nr:hypothetical protein K439DRAFT_1394760 [Ramaria rubella]